MVLLDSLFFETLGFPDLRPDGNAIFLPDYCKKDYIQNGEKPKRDYLANLFMAKPDYEDVHKKLFYATYAGAKLCMYMQPFFKANQFFNYRNFRSFPL